MEITIQPTKSSTGAPRVSIWFGNKQVILNENEFESLKNNIDSFVNADIKLIGYTTYFKPDDNHNEYLEIDTKVKGKECREIFVLKHRKERQEYLNYIKQHGMITEEEYKRYLPAIELADKDIK